MTDAPDLIGHRSSAVAPARARSHPATNVPDLIGHRSLTIGRSGGGLLAVGRDDPELDLGVDVLAEVELDGVEAELLERPFDPDVGLLDRQVVGAERGGDLVDVDRAVEV